MVFLAEMINFCDFQKVPADKSLIIFSFLLSTSNEIINTCLFVYHMAGSQLEVVSAPEKILVFTSRITARGISKSMSNALSPVRRLLGYLRRNTRLVKSITVRRSA